MELITSPDHAQFVLSIQSRGLYVTINSKKPEESDPLYDKWIAGNSLVMSCLLHSMKPHIS